MTGRRQARKSASTTRGSSTKPAHKTAPEATHLVTKTGAEHKDVVSTTEATHGPNMADRMDTMDAHATEVLPTAEHNTIPASRRIDEGQNRGTE